MPRRKTLTDAGLRSCRRVASPTPRWTRNCRGITSGCALLGAETFVAVARNPNGKRNGIPSARQRFTT